MKNIGIVLTLMVLFVGLTSGAQDEPKVKTVKIKTSAVCGMCKDRLEKKLNYTKGVIFAELDLDSKEITIKYKTKHLSEAMIRKIIAQTGYDADDVKRDQEAYENLPKCCQGPGLCKD